MATSLIITAATVFTTLTNLSGTPNSKYYYNAEYENGKVSQITVLNNDTYLTKKLTHRYEYDNQDRLVNKETLAWDNAKQAWVKRQMEHYDYSDNQIEMTLSRWNAKKQQYDLAERYNYSLIQDHVIAITKEKWDKNQNNMACAEHILMMNANNDLAQVAITD